MSGDYYWQPNPATLPYTAPIQGTAITWDFVSRWELNALVERVNQLEAEVKRLKRRRYHRKKAIPQ